MQIVVPVQKHTQMWDRFKSHQKSGITISYHATASDRPRCKHKIVSSKDGLPGEENFYLTVLGF
jgi:hypothetical protein